MGIALQQFLRLRQTHLQQQFNDALTPLLFYEPGMQFHRLVYLPADPRSRCQRLAGILWNEGELTAANVLEGPLAHVKYIAPTKQGFALQDAEATLQVTHHGQGQGALAAPRFANQSNRLAFANRQIDVPQDRQCGPRPAGKAYAQILYLDERLAHHEI